MGSFHQLLLDYQKHSSRFGPSSSKGKWLPEPRDQPYNHKQHTLWMSQFLKNISQHSKVPITIEQRRPPSHMLAFWCGCIRVNIEMSRLHTVDDHFKAHTQVVPVRNIPKDLAKMVPGFSWNSSVSPGEEHPSPNLRADAPKRKGEREGFDPSPCLENATGFLVVE